MDTATLNKLFEEQKAVFEQFKGVNDKLIAEQKEHGEGLAMTKEQLEKLEKNLNEKMGEIEKAIAALNRPPDTGPLKEASEQMKLFDKFLRKGPEQLTPEELKILTVSDDTTGGFLSPEEFVMEIDKDVIEFSPIRAISRIRTTSRKSVQLPRRTGVFAADWTGEGQTQSETTGLTYGLPELPVHPLRALVKISREDLEDPAFNMEAEIRAEFAEQFGVAEGKAFVSGNGVARPEGFLTVTANSVTEVETNTTAVLSADDLIDTMFSNIKSAYWANATWVMNRITIGRVRKLKDSDNQYLWQPGLNGPTSQTLLGRPIVEATDMPSTIAAGDQIIAFGDFRRAYTIVDRVSMDIIRDPFTSAKDGLVEFLAFKRVGGFVLRSEAIVILKAKT